jgi:hypothetical protein
MRRVVLPRRKMLCDWISELGSDPMRYYRPLLLTLVNLPSLKKEKRVHLDSRLPTLAKHPQNT